MRNLIKKSGEWILFPSIIILVVVVVSWLRENNQDGYLELILAITVLWIIWLYITKSEVTKKYGQLLSFSYKFYEKTKRHGIDEYDFENCTLSDFEDEFEEWLKKKIAYKKYLTKQVSTKKLVKNEASKLYSKFIDEYPYINK